VNAASALAAAGQIARASPPPAGVLASSHFGGGPAAVPPVPVAPRGSAILVGYALWAIAGLGLVAFAASRLFSLSGPDYAAADGPGPAWPAGPSGPDGPPTPAPAAGLDPDPYGRRPAGDATTLPRRFPAGNRPDAGSAPAGPRSSDGPWTGPPGAGPAGWLTAAPPSQPRHAAPRGRDTGPPDLP
jgi:hypothetical protein